MKKGKIADLPLELVVPDPKQPRTHFDKDKMTELAMTIENDGLLNPILVRPIEDGKYRIVHGERRYRACKSLSLETIRAEIRELSDEEAIEIQIVENAQREDLNPIEEARAFRRMVEELDYTHEKVAERIGKSREYVTNKLRLLRLPKDIQKGIARRKLSEGNARQLLALKDAKAQRLLCRRISQNKLSVRRTEKTIQWYKRRSVSRETSLPQDSERSLDVNILEVWKTIAPEASAKRKVPVDELISAYIKDLRKLRKL